MLPKKMVWLKEHFEGMLTEKEESLWDDYELGNLPYNMQPDVAFETGWDLGRIEAIQELINYIEDLENPVYGDK